MPFWETPRNIAILVGTIVAIVGALAAAIGYKIGQGSPPAQIVFQPGAIQIAPVAPEREP